MKLLLIVLAIALNPLITDVNEYAGSWSYSISTPDGNIKGAMTLVYEDGEYSGSISAYGQEHEMLDVEVADNKLSFKTNAGGYSSTISGTFEGNKYTAVISVEGMQIPMTAIKEK